MERPRHNNTNSDLGQGHWPSYTEDRHAPQWHEAAVGAARRVAHDSGGHGLASSATIRTASPSDSQGEIYVPHRRYQVPWGERPWGGHENASYHPRQASSTRLAAPPSSNPFERWARVYSEPRDLSHLKESPIAGVEVKRSLLDMMSSHARIDSSSSPDTTTLLGRRPSPDITQVQPEQPAKRVKEPRYLRELDRREILARLATGEKQSVLAKEYQVSHSTICNLLKQRDVVLARKTESPLSRHPKKTRQHLTRRTTQASTTPTSTDCTAPVKTTEEETPTTPTTSPRGSDEDFEQTRGWSQYSPPLKPKFVRIESRAISLLQTYLYNRDTSSADFRRYCARLLRLLLEESLAAVAEAYGVNDTLASYIRNSSDPMKKPLCAISMEQRSTPMLDTFGMLEPHSRFGALRYDSSGLVLRGPNLPEDFRGYEVLLLDIVSDSGRNIAAAIDKLLERGAQEASLTVITVAITAEAMDAVRHSFPRVRIATAGVGPSDTDHRYGRAPPTTTFFHQRVLAAYS